MLAEIDRERHPVDELEALYRSERARIYRLCLARLRDPVEAEDAVQETFLRAARHVEHLRGDARTYLVVIARNVCNDRGRARARAQRNLVRLQSGDEMHDRNPEDTAISASHLERVWSALSPRDRLLLLHSARGFSAPEIAAMLRVAPDAATRALSRARARARDLFAENNGIAVLPVAATLKAKASWLVQRARQFAEAAGSLGDIRNVVACSGAAVLAAAAFPSTTSPSSTPGARPPAALPASSLGSPSAIARGQDAAPPMHVPLQASTALPPRALPTGGSFSATRATTSQPFGAGDQQPEDTSITNVATSPDYESDHTAYASGDTNTVVGQTSPVLFRSTDGGASWQRRAATGFSGGRLLVADDGSLFTIEMGSIARSLDGGGTFTPLIGVPLNSNEAADLSPGTAPLIVLATVPLTVFHPTSGTVTPGPVLPQWLTSIDRVSFLGDQQHVLVLAPYASDGTEAAVWCDLSTACTTVATLPPAFDRPMVLRVSRNFVHDHTVAALFTDRVAVSTDGKGASWRITPVPNAAALAIAPEGRVVVASMPTAGPRYDTSRLVSSSVDGGSTFAPVRQSGLPPAAAVSDLAITSTGRTFAGVVAFDPYVMGVACSADAGAWNPRC